MKISWICHVKSLYLSPIRKLAVISVPYKSLYLFRKVVISVAFNRYICPYEYLYIYTNQLVIEVSI
jgi:hypothetical protein